MRVPPRFDFRFPFSINGILGQAQQSTYEAHVAEMIRQFILTTPGERVCRPDFGGGLRSLLFAPNRSDLASSTELLIRHGLQTYLGQQINVSNVTVSNTSMGASSVDILIEYVLIDTQSSNSISVTLV